MSSLRAVVVLIRFAAELVVLAAVAAWGAQLTDGPMRWVTAVSAAVAVAAVWGRWIAPKSNRRLADPARLIVEGAVFVVAGAAALAVTPPSVAIGFTVVASVDALLLRIVGEPAPHLHTAAEHAA